MPQGGWGRFHDSTILALVAVAAFVTGRILESGGWISVDGVVLRLIGTVMLSHFTLMHQYRGRRALAD